MTPRDSEPDETRIRAYLNGDLSHDDRRSFEGSVLASESLARSLYEMVNMDACVNEALSGRAEAAAPETEKRRGWWERWSVRVLVPAAAACIVIVAAVHWMHREGPPATTGVLRGSGGSVRGLSPSGPVDQFPRLFVWTRDAKATRYRVSLYDSESRLLYQTFTSDTTALVPSALADTTRARSGYWTVVPLDEVMREMREGSPVPFVVR